MGFDWIQAIHDTEAEYKRKMLMLATNDPNVALLANDELDAYERDLIRESAGR